MLIFFFRFSCFYLQVDVDECEELAMRYEISSMPTFVFIKKGEKIDVFSGANADRLEKTIIQHLKWIFSINSSKFSFFLKIVFNTQPTVTTKSHFYVFFSSFEWVNCMEFHVIERFM